MQELVNRLTSQVGLSPEQSKQAIETIAGFVKEKFPMMAGAVDQLFSTGGDDNNKNDIMGGLPKF